MSPASSSALRHLRSSYHQLSLALTNLGPGEPVPGQYNEHRAHLLAARDLIRGVADALKQEA